MANADARTLYAKIWDDHVVTELGGEEAVLYVDLHMLHDASGVDGFAALERRGLPVRRPDRHVGTLDHMVWTAEGAGCGGAVGEQIAARMAGFAASCRQFGVPLHDIGSHGQGVTHVAVPEQGLTLPGMTVVCGDSHTSTHGAFGALAFGIGATEIGHVMATQTLLQRRSKVLALTVEGALPRGVEAKDVALACIRELGVSGGVGHVIEYRGPVVRNLSMDGRMTLCNMSIEAGARGGMIGVDEVTVEYLGRCPYTPRGAELAEAAARWQGFVSDAGAVYDREVRLDATALAPMVSYGTTPAMCVPVTGCVPTPAACADAEERAALERSLAYMGLEAGRPMAGIRLDVVFLGSCTNGRLSDLRTAAGILARAAASAASADDRGAGFGARAAAGGS